MFSPSTITDFETLFLLAVDVQCVLMHDGTLLKVNPAVEPVLGYQPDELINRNVFELIHPDDLAKTKREMEKQLFQDLPSINVEIRIRTKLGGFKTLSWSGRTNPEDQISYCIGRDISLQKELEQTVETNQQLYEHVTEAGHLGIWDWDISKNEIYIDHQINKLMGFSTPRTTTTLQEWADRVHPEDLPELMTEVNECLQGRGRAARPIHR